MVQLTKLIRALLAAGLLALLASPAFSQWQVTSGSVPLGRGPGVVGFNSVAPASGMTTWWVTPSSANLQAALTDEVGTGAAYFVNGALGTPASATLTNATGLPISTGVSGLGTGVATWLATPSSANLASAVTDETGSGALVFGTAPQISTIELGNASDTTLARVSAGLVSVEGVTILTVATGQPLDADLTTIAGLTATTDNFLQAKSSAWASRTPAQVTADLSVMVGDSGSGGSKGLVPAPVAGDASKFLRGDGTFVAIPGGGDALVANPLSQFAATTSTQLRGVISDETGAGAAVFADDPLFATAITVPNTGLHLLDTDASHDLILKPGSNVTADRTLTLTTGDTDITADLTDAGSDKPLFWDDSAGAWVALTLPANLVISGTSLRAYETWCIAISDETTAITTGTAKASWSFPTAWTVVGVYGTLNTVSSSGTPTFDINEEGTSIISTKIVIDVSEKTGGSSGYQGTAAGAAVISDSAIAAFAQMTVDIDTAGTGAKGAKVCLIGYP